MRKCLLLFIVLFSCLNLYSQNLSYLFQNDLPKDIHKYFTDGSVNDILTGDAELNPELIYWRINFYKELVENKNTNNDKNGLSYLNKLINQNCIERNRFLDTIKFIAGKEVSNEYKRKIDDILSDYTINYKQDFKQNNDIPDYDANKIYYLAAKYLSVNRELSYDNAKEYQAIVKEIEMNKVADLKKKLSELKNQQGKITIDYLECIINNWRLVKNNPGIIEDLSSATEEYIDQKYSIRKLGRMDITAGYAYTAQDSWISHDLIYPYINKTDHITETRNYTTVIIQAEYKFFIKELISFLSYINIGISASIASSPSITRANIFLSEDYNVRNDANYSNRYFTANDIKISQQKFYSLYGKISVPVFAISPDFILHAGIIGGTNNYIAELTYNYSYRNTEYSWTPNAGYQYFYLQNDKNVPRKESISRHIFYVSPVVELNLNLLKNILFKFTTSGYNFFSINAGVEF